MHSVPLSQGAHREVDVRHSWPHGSDRGLLKCLSAWIMAANRSRPLLGCVCLIPVASQAHQQWRGSARNAAVSLQGRSIHVWGTIGGDWAMQRNFLSRMWEPESVWFTLSWVPTDTFHGEIMGNTAVLSSDEHRVTCSKPHPHEDGERHTDRLKVRVTGRADWSDHSHLSVNSRPSWVTF